MSVLNQFRGKFEIEIDGKKFEVYPTKEDKWDIMGLQKKATNLQPEDLKKLDEIEARILKNSMPNESSEDISEFLLRHGDDFLLQLSVGFGWLKKEDLKKIRERMEEKPFREPNAGTKAS